MAQDDAETLESLLSPEDGPFAEWTERGCICVVTQSTGERRTTYLVHEIVEPNPDDLTEKEKEIGVELEFETQYKRRARRRAKEVYGKVGLMYVHTHPRSSSGRFSQGDLKHDRAQLYEETERLGEDVPLLVTVAHDGDDPWQVWRYSFRRSRTPAQRASEAFGPVSATRTAITAIRVVGPKVEKRKTYDSSRVDGPRGARGELNEDQQDSTIRLWGKKGQRRLAGIRVGFIGCGGGGSIIAPTLAQTGVGEEVLLDFDRLEPANANRHMGVAQNDIGEERLKIEVTKRVAEDAATAPGFKAVAVDGSAFENEWEKYDKYRHLLDCDILVNVADPDTVRSMVNRLAYAHLIPVIDGGSKMIADSGVLTEASRATSAVAGPGMPCLKCVGQWTDTGFSKHATADGQVAHRYGDDVDDDDEDEQQTVREPSAMPTNLLTMGLAGQRFLTLVHGLAPDALVGKLNFRLHSMQSHWLKSGSDRMEECRSSCTRPPTGLGDGASLKRGPDWHLREKRRDELPNHIEAPERDDG